MYVENAKILFVGEIQDTTSGHKKLVVDVETNSTGKKRYVVFENSIRNFDLVRLFKQGYYRIGQIIDFNYNQAVGSWAYDSIWKIKLRKNVDE